jgi:hypothetical protein
LGFGDRFGIAFGLGLFEGFLGLVHRRDALGEFGFFLAVNRLTLPISLRYILTESLTLTSPDWIFENSSMLASSSFSSSSAVSSSTASSSTSFWALRISFSLPGPLRSLLLHRRRL